MKHIYYSTLLGAALLCNVFVFGQGRKLDSLHFSKPHLDWGEDIPGYMRPPLVMKLAPRHRSGVRALRNPVDSVRIMAPDRMPCLVTNLSKMEPMPVQRYRNLEPMPNGVQRW